MKGLENDKIKKKNERLKSWQENLTMSNYSLTDCTTVDHVNNQWSCKSTAYRITFLRFGLANRI